MARFYPTIDQIKNDSMEKHTAGEMALLQELANLPDDFNVYFQPHINYAHPDVVIECADHGILIIEVKDWDLSYYTYHWDTKEPGEDKYGYLTVPGSDAHLMTPFEQVQFYKDELFNLSPELCAARLRKETVSASGKNSPVYGVIKTCVYFSNASEKNLKDLFREDRFSRQYNYLTFNKWIICLTGDDNGHIATTVVDILKQNKEYTKTIHADMEALFVPSVEWLEQTSPIILTAEQERYARCTRERQRIRGTAGSGKTLILAQKAINCYKTKHEPVLILTYNITLKNYIRDKIAVNSRDLTGRERSLAFELLHFDQFLSQVMTRFGLKNPSKKPYTYKNGKIDWEAYRAEQMQIVRDASDRIKPYSTVLIDEAQDFSSEWFALIQAIFITDNTDYLVVADEKQNIYGQPLDNNRLPIIKGFRGPWATLKDNFRMTESGYTLAIKFQQAFMTRKYTIDDLGQLNGSSQIDIFPNMETEKRAYIHLDEFDPEIIFKEILSFSRSDKPISPNDICVLTFSNNDIRHIDSCFRNHLGPRSTQTVSETLEMYQTLKEKNGVGSPDILEGELATRNANFAKDLNDIRRVKRNRFNMNTGTIKISTVHSFKGWEINTVVLVIDDIGQDNTAELIYTAITRTKGNLLIINCGDNPYHEFFQRELSGNKTTH